MYSVSAQKHDYDVWMHEYRRVFFHDYFCNFYIFEDRGQNSLIISSGETTASLILVSQIRNPISNDLKQNNAKIYNEDVSNNKNKTKRSAFENGKNCYVLDTRRTECDCRPLPRVNEWLNLVSVCSK